MEIRECVDEAHTYFPDVSYVIEFNLVISCMDHEFFCVSSLLSSFSLIGSTRIVQFGMMYNNNERR